MPSRPFYAWDELEEYQGDGGMWRIVSGPRRQEYIDASAGLMREPKRFADAMRQALHDWPRSCVVNLLTPSKNQRAWLGHAGCFLATGSPEECTRIGWHTLNDAQQHKANLAADIVLREWRVGGLARLQLELFRA